MRVKLLFVVKVELTVQIERPQVLPLEQSRSSYVGSEHADRIFCVAPGRGSSSRLLPLYRVIDSPMARNRNTLVVSHFEDNSLTSGQRA